MQAMFWRGRLVVFGGGRNRPPFRAGIGPDLSLVNAKDLVEISESIKKDLDIVAVSRMDEVLARAMTRKSPCSP